MISDPFFFSIRVELPPFGIRIEASLQSTFCFSGFLGIWPTLHRMEFASEKRVLRSAFMKSSTDSFHHMVTRSKKRVVETENSLDTTVSPKNPSSEVEVGDISHIGNAGKCS